MACQRRRFVLIFVTMVLLACNTAYFLRRCIHLWHPGSATISHEPIHAVFTKRTNSNNSFHQAAFTFLDDERNVSSEIPANLHTFPPRIMNETHAKLQTPTRAANMSIHSYAPTKAKLCLGNGSRITWTWSQALTYADKHSTLKGLPERLRNFHPTATIERWFTFALFLLWNEGGIWVGKGLRCSKRWEVGTRTIGELYPGRAGGGLVLFGVPLNIEALNGLSESQRSDGMRQTIATELVIAHEKQHPVLEAALQQIISRDAARVSVPHGRSEINFVQAILMDKALRYVKMHHALPLFHANPLSGYPMVVDNADDPTLSFLESGLSKILKVSKPIPECYGAAIMLIAPTYRYPQCGDFGPDKIQMETLFQTEQTEDIDDLLSYNDASDSCFETTATYVYPRHSETLPFYVSYANENNAPDASPDIKLPQTYSVNIKTTRRRSIPKIIHQIDFKPSTEGAGAPLYETMKSWRDLNPTYKYVLWTDDTMEEFVREKADHQTFATYQALDFVQKSDLFRYLVLFHIGGVYADHDAECIQPVDNWNIGVSAEIVVGIEAWGTSLQRKRLLWARNPQYCQWTLAAAPGHPILWSAVSRIREKVVSLGLSVPKFKGSVGGCKEIGHKSCVQTLELTGPGQFSEGVAQYVRMFGVNPSETVAGMQVGTCLIVPINAFACGQTHSGSNLQCYKSKGVLVRHLFAGNWKKTGDVSEESTSSTKDGSDGCGSTVSILSKLKSLSGLCPKETSKSFSD